LPKWPSLDKDSRENSSNCGSKECNLIPEWRLAQTSPPSGERGWRRLVLIAEGEAQFFGHLRPKFSQFVITNIQRHIYRDTLRRGRKATFCSGVVEVTERRTTDFSQPFGKIKHGPAIVVVRDHGVGHGVHESPPFCALAYPVVPRVFGEDRGISKLLEKPELNFIGIARGISFGISLATLVKGRIVILCL